MRNKTKLPSLLLGLVLVLIVIPGVWCGTLVHRQVSENRSAWTAHGFYGIPVETWGINAAGEREKIVLTSSFSGPLPSEWSQWKYASLQVFRRYFPADE